jgi:Raf kinase inhibitor-like YbhB/YbcL family protein
MQRFAFAPWLVLSALTAAIAIGCRKETPPPVPRTPPDAGAVKPAAGKTQFTISSSAFAEGQPVPKKHTEDGDDVSPPLAWSGVPQGTKELALVCDDPDAPSAEPWVHWVIYKIPADAKGLPQAVPPDERLKEPPGALQGKNSWPDGRTAGYRGPAPPPGKPHRYYFRLYALDAPLESAPGLEKGALVKAMAGHVLGEATLMGTYKR